MYGKDCLILIPFRLPEISCFTLSLKCFFSDSDNFPNVGIGPLFQFPHLLRAGPVLLTLLLPPPSFFILPSFAWFYIFFSTGQVLLSALSWCSACMSVSEGVFLMYLWREMDSMSAYSSTILFSNLWFLFKKNIAFFFLEVLGLTRICTITFKVSLRLLHPKVTSYISTVFPKPGNWHWNKLWTQL